MTDIVTHAAIAAQGDDLARPVVNAPTNATFKKTHKILCISSSLSNRDDIRLLEQLKTGFQRTIKWNKYRSEMSTQTKTDNLNYLIDPRFDKVDRLFVLPFKLVRTSFSTIKLKVEIKDFNLLIDGKSFFHVLVKNKETYYKN